MTNPPTKTPQQEILDFYNETAGKKVGLINTNLKAIDKALEKYNLQEIKMAILGCLKYETYVNIKYKTLEYTMRINESRETDHVLRFKKLCREDNIVKVEKDKTILNDDKVRVFDIVEVKNYNEKELDECVGGFIKVYEFWFNVSFDMKNKERVELLKNRIKEYGYDLIMDTMKCYYHRNKGGGFYMVEDILYINKDEVGDTSNNIIKYGVNLMKVSYNFKRDFSAVIEEINIKKSLTKEKDMVK